MGLGDSYFEHVMDKYPHPTLLNAEKLMLRCFFLMDARLIAF